MHDFEENITLRSGLVFKRHVKRSFRYIRGKPFMSTRRFLYELHISRRKKNTKPPQQSECFDNTMSIMKHIMCMVKMRTNKKCRHFGESTFSHT